MFWSGKWLTHGARPALFTPIAQGAVEFKAAARTNSQAGYLCEKSNEKIRPIGQIGPIRTYEEIATSALLGGSYFASASTFAVFASSALVSSRHV